MTGGDIFWLGLSLVIFGLMNFGLYRVRMRESWDDNPTFPLLPFGLVIGQAMFLINAPKPLAEVGGPLLFFGTVAHAIFAGVASLPIFVRQRRKAEELNRENARKAENEAAAQARRLKTETEHAQTQATLAAITVDGNGVSSIAKRIVEELARANS
jgi:hypothetical protein